jgi:large subunit ribosomal protein L10
MAVTREKKAATLSEIESILANSKMTVFVSYQGTPVKALQQLRADAKANGTQLKVLKNRLFKLGLQSNDILKNVNTSPLTGQLLYAFNDDDEVAPAQDLANFAKTNPQIVFVGAITGDGQLLSADDVKQLASLPTKDQLRGQLVGLVASPLSGLASVMAANIRGVLNVLNARAEGLN